MHEIELYSKINDPMTACAKMGEWFARSGMFGCKSVEQGQVLALACMAERKTPVQIMREYHMIDGKLSMRADAMLAGLRQNGGKHKIIKRTADKAEIEVTVDGNTQKFSFSWDEAKHEPFVSGKDGKLKTNWATPRARMQMLWARCVSDAVRAMMPEVVAGVYTPEEVQDFEPSRSPRVVDVQAMVETDAPQSVGTDELQKPAVIDAEVEPVAVDCTLMPVGNKAGQPFVSFTLKQLQTIAKKGKTMAEFTEAHLSEITKAIKAKESEASNG